MSFDAVWSRGFDAAFCQSDWSQALAPPPHSLHAPKSHTGTKAKVSVGLGCDAGLEGVDPLGGPDRGPSIFFFFFFNPHSEWAQRGENP